MKMKSLTLIAKGLEKGVSKYRWIAVLYAMIMNMLSWLLAGIQLLTFTHHKYKPVKTAYKERLYELLNEINDKLSNQLATYRKNYGEVTDEDGFIEYKKCDSLLFSSLYYAAGMDVNITMAQDKGTPGKWYRRNIRHQQCYPAFSGSSISRDMLIGLMVGAFMRSNFTILLDLYNYGKKHSWLMGEGALSRIHLGSTLENTLALCLMNSKFSNEFNKLEFWQKLRIRISSFKPVVYGKGLKKYQLHLQALTVFLRVLAQGGFTNQDILAVRDGSRDYLNETNLLMIILYAATPNQSDNLNNIYASFHASAIVDRLSIIYPIYQLPSSDRIGSHWLWEGNERVTPPRDEEGGGNYYSGGDILFLQKFVQVLLYTKV